MVANWHWAFSERTLVFLSMNPATPASRSTKRLSPVFTADLAAFRDRDQAAPTEAAITGLAARLRIRLSSSLTNAGQRCATHSSMQWHHSDSAFARFSLPNRFQLSGARWPSSARPIQPTANTEQPAATTEVSTTNFFLRWALRALA